MKVFGKSYQSIWLEEQDEKPVVYCIDQNRLPWEFSILEIISSDQMFNAIREMKLRGAPLLGVAGACGLLLAIYESTNESEPFNYINSQAKKLASARPTAINLATQISRVLSHLAGLSPGEWLGKVKEMTRQIIQEEIEKCKAIGEQGVKLIEAQWRKNPDKPVQILTHCNAGWLACVDYGTVTAPIYLAHEKGIPLHIWVDETRPRNQGARLTAWELQQEGIPHSLIADNAGGYLMQTHQVDMVITGTDRVLLNGTIANKIGTYLKALAAFDNTIPFYVATPSSSIDFDKNNTNIPIEERCQEEVLYFEGWDGKHIVKTLAAPFNTKAANPAFDLTPPNLITALITERGICKPSENQILSFFPEKKL